MSQEFGPKRRLLRDVPSPETELETPEARREARDPEVPAEDSGTDDRDRKEADAEPEDRAKRDKRDKAERMSPTMTAIRNEEERSLKEWLDGLGQVGAFKVQLRREQPKHVRVNGRDVKTEGFLETYDHSIDEEFIQKEHGGGTYAIKVTRRGANGSYKYEPGLHRTITIAGDPSLERLPSSTPAAGAAPAPTQPAEGLGFVKETFGVLTKEIDRLHERSERKEPVVPKGIDPALQVVLDQMRRDADRRDKEVGELRVELARARDTKPAEDPIKDKILGSLIDGESGRIAALRLTHDSELRQIKDATVAEQSRRDDRHERDVAALRAGHEREIATMKASYEREIAALRQTHEVTSAISTQSSNLQLKVLENDNKRLERELDALRIEVKDLRARKDKTIVEQAKDLETIKDALGLDSGDKTNFDKLLEVVSSPAAAEFVGRIVGGKETAAATTTAATAQAAGPSRTLVQAADGQKYWHVTDGKGGQRLVPAKKKPKVIPAIVNPDGTVATPEIVLPEIDPTQIAVVVGYLERAFASRQEPEVVAQSGRTTVPEEILTWIRTHDTEQVSGVDLFMSKVAKLPGTSPLLSQAGKNWLRKVGKALVGD